MSDFYTTFLVYPLPLVGGRQYDAVFGLFVFSLDSYAKAYQCLVCPSSGRDFKGFMRAALDSAIAYNVLYVKKCKIYDLLQAIGIKERNSAQNITFTSRIFGGAAVLGEKIVDFIGFVFGSQGKRSLSYLILEFNTVHEWFGSLSFMQTIRLVGFNKYL